MDTLNTLNTGTNIHLTALSGNGVLGGRKRSQPGYNKGLRPSVSRIEGHQRGGGISRAPAGGGTTSQPTNGRGGTSSGQPTGGAAPADPPTGEAASPAAPTGEGGGGAAQRHAPNTLAGSDRHRHQSVRHHRTNSGTTGSGNGHRQHSVGTTSVRESCDGRAPRRRTVGPAGGGGGGDVCVPRQLAN